MPIRDEPACRAGCEILTLLRGGPASGMTTKEVANKTGLHEVDCRLILRRLVDEGWVLDNGRRASARRLFAAPHQARETDGFRYPVVTRYAGRPSVHPDGPPPKIVQVVRDTDKSAEAALTAWLVEETKRDPIAMALALASTDALVAEINRRRVANDAWTEMGLPPEA